MFWMNNRFSAYLLFYVLGLVFWLLSMSVDQSTLLCVFYSFFVGTVWGLTQSTWKQILPPFLLVILMMFAARMKMVMATEVVLITAMSLIHFRACVLSFIRVTKKASVFSWIQLASFIYSLVYLFQKNILPFSVSRNLFLMSMFIVNALSLGILLMVKNDQAHRNN